MYSNTGYIPDTEDIADVTHDVRPYRDTESMYALRLNHTVSITSTDPRLARDYFAAIAKAAQELVDAADQAVLAEALDGAA